MRILNSIGKFFLASSIKEYADVLDLSIDRVNKSAHVSFILKGESEKIDIYIGKYEIVESECGMNVIVGDLKSSKEWMHAILKDFVEGKSFSIGNSVPKFAIKMMFE